MNVGKRDAGHWRRLAENGGEVHFHIPRAPRIALLYQNGALDGNQPDDGPPAEVGVQHRVKQCNGGALVFHDAGAIGDFLRYMMPAPPPLEEPAAEKKKTQPVPVAAEAALS